MMTCCVVSLSDYKVITKCLFAPIFTYFCLFAPNFTYFCLFSPTLFIFIFGRNIYRHQHFHFLAFLLGGLDLEGTSIGINLCQSLGIRISILLSLPVNTTLSFPSGPGNWVSRWFSKQPKRWPLISLWLNWASETFKIKRNLVKKF